VRCGALDAARARLVRSLAQGARHGCGGGVRYWQLGENEWKETPSWPPPNEEVRWYLREGGALARGEPGDEPADAYVYDPLDPVPTVYGKTLMPTILPAGIGDQTAVEGREDVLCYTSPALSEPLVVNGRIRVELWASSSAVDTDFTAKLVDVSPGGYAMNLADGILRARHRESPRKRSAPLEPGQPTALTIDLWDLAHTFQPGHRLRLEVSSSNFPRFDRNTNTGNDLGKDGAGEVVRAEQRVLHDTDHPSSVVLPVATVAVP